VGSFAALFPGVILAFFLLPPSPGILRVMVALGGGAAFSWILTWILVRVFRPSWTVAFRVLGALSAGLFFTFTLPATAAAWGVPAYSGPLTGAALILVGIWTLRAPSEPRVRSARSPLRTAGPPTRS
jgi:hypothetical protein